ncbi:hypothetical protein ACFWBC_37630 [Streptomyces sp. NPDC059985]|uniref:hypothetical protein n=1 Tax=Streptomyces sp. NPDC059985 TaxID=3347025 RepID=UPI0036A15B75
MARNRKADPARRRSDEAARRAAATERVGPRTPRTPRVKLLHALRPPGEYYQLWAEPSTQFLQDPEAALKEAIGRYGEDSCDAATLRVFAGHAESYGHNVPTAAAAHLDLLVRSSGMATAMAAAITDGDEEETLAAVHRLHGMGMLLVDDEGAVWLTVPPGTPVSAPNGEWRFVEKKIPAPGRWSN